MSRFNRTWVIWNQKYRGSYHDEKLANGETMRLIHFDIFQWTPSVLRELKQLWSEWRPTQGLLFCMGHEDDEKFSRFIAHFGFQYLSEIPCSDDQVRKLYVNYPNP